MTGEKNRFKTTEKLWDLDDKQLKTPKHDAMVLWLMEKSNFTELLDIKEFLTRNFNGHNFRFDYKKMNINLEVPVMSSSTFIAGYLDLKITVMYWCNDNGALNYTTRGRVIRYPIEVKPHIDSFGAVLRQITSYKQFLHMDDGEYFYLFTLDDRFDAQFESQGIHVLHPPEDVTIEDMLEMYGLK